MRPKFAATCLKKHWTRVIHSLVDTLSIAIRGDGVPIGGTAVPIRNLSYEEFSSLYPKECKRFEKVVGAHLF